MQNWHVKRFINTAGVVSYSAPQGDVFRSVDLIDESYDGIIENGFLKGEQQFLRFYSLDTHTHKSLCIQQVKMKITSMFSVFIFVFCIR